MTYDWRPLTGQGKTNTDTDTRSTHKHRHAQKYTVFGINIIFTAQVLTNSSFNAETVKNSTLIHPLNERVIRR
jgi:hypothetical protein